MTLRIVVEGSPGSGKTTLIEGKGHEDKLGQEYPSLKSKGFYVASESFTTVAREMRAQGIEPMENFPEIFSRFVTREFKRYSVPNGASVVFFDKGVPGYSFLAYHFHQEWGPDFYDALEQLVYDSPVFVLAPITDFDLSMPRNQQRARVFTLEQRQLIHRSIIEAYRRRGYSVIEVPVLSDDPRENACLRLEQILSRLQLA